MMNAISNSADHFFSSTSNWDILTVSELDALLAQYPYFSLLHLLRARKLRLDGAEENPMDFKKTTLYFNNIPWLMYQYNQQPIFSRPAEKVVPVAEIMLNETLEQDSIEEVDPINLIEVDALDEDNPINIIEVDAFSEDLSINVIEVDASSEDVQNQLITAPEALETITEPIEMGIHQDEITIEECEKIVYKEDQYKQPNQENVQASIEPIASTPVENKATYFEVAETTSAIEANEALTSEGEYIETTIDADNSFIIENDSILETTTEINTPIIENDYPIPIEDISGTDYFAAQGIKIADEISPKSSRVNLTQNSFTGWLKAMQKVESSEPIEQLQEQNLYNSQLFSLIDNEEIEVFTETMADVYIKQGLNKKAILIFEKLSLIYPTKSTYFASRIDKINII